jgi:hypothetical protein
MARKVMYVCLGILALAGAFHLGASRGETQTGMFSGVCQVGGRLFAITDAGDLYYCILPPGEEPLPLV